MSKPADDLEAVRTVVESVQGFDKDAQQRIFRWAAEKLDLPHPFSSGVPPPSKPTNASEPLAATPPSSPSKGPVTDIKSFVTAKKPVSDVQFAATVAYYYQFVAPLEERKAGITKDDLVDAIRKVRDRKMPPHPDMTLNNTYQRGLLDRSDKGVYTINSVGENLVAMTLPSNGFSGAVRKKSPSKPRTSAAKASKRSAARSKARARS